jgi:hypothetical protein
MMGTEQEQKERTDIGVFTTVTGAGLNIVEALGHGKISIPSLPYAGIAYDTLGNIASQSSDGKLTGRDLAEATGEAALGAAGGKLVGSGIARVAAAGAARGAVMGSLGGIPGAIVGAVGGAALGALIAPYGGRIMGAIYDQAMKNRVQPDPNSVYTPMGDYTGFIDDSSGQGDLDKFRKQAVAPSPQLTYGINRDKSPFPTARPVVRRCPLVRRRPLADERRPRPGRSQTCRCRWERPFRIGAPRRRNTHWGCRCRAAGGSRPPRCRPS